MFFPLFIALILIGAVLLVALIAFAHRRQEPARLEPLPAPPDWEGKGSPDSVLERKPPFAYRPDPRGRSGAEGFSGTGGAETRGSGIGASKAGGPVESGSGAGQSEARGSDAGGDVSKPGADSGKGSRGGTGAAAAGPTIPVVEPGKPVPGLGKYELVHFFSRARMYTFEDERTLEDVRFDESRLTPEVEGELAVTSKKLVLFDDKTVKKLPFGVIESRLFGDGTLLLKKKNVKKKKTVVKIFGNFDDFRYILDVVLHT